jgi:preprotein translocase subunit YajC
MKKGDSVKVKNGIMSPDYDNLSIAGWQGRITELDCDTIAIELDSVTLGNLNKSYIVESITDGVEYTHICLDRDEVELTTPRDTQKDTLLKQQEMSIKYAYYEYSNEYDDEEKRIIAALKTEDIYGNADNHIVYLDYLKDNIKKPCILTGSEDFSWEEPYLLGGWCEKEYERLKLTHPSYTDEFELLEILDKIDAIRGIFVKVKRLSDNKMFELPLWDLKVIDEKSSNYLLILDYSSWMTNYQ